MVVFLDVCFQASNRAFVESFCWVWPRIFLKVIWCGMGKLIRFWCNFVKFLVPCFASMSACSFPSILISLLLAKIRRIHVLELSGLDEQCSCRLPTRSQFPTLTTVAPRLHANPPHYRQPWQPTLVFGIHTPPLFTQQPTLLKTNRLLIPKLHNSLGSKTPSPLALTLNGQQWTLIWTLPPLWLSFNLKHEP